MFKKLIGYAKGLARRVTTAVTEIVRSAANSLARAWARHSEHMAANPAYRAALVAATASVITQVRLDRLAVALLLAVEVGPVPVAVAVTIEAFPGHAQREPGGHAAVAG